MAIGGGPRAGRWPRSLQEPRQDLVGRPDSPSLFPDIKRKSSCLEPFPPQGTQPAQVLPRGCRPLGGAGRGSAGERNPKSHDNPNALPGLAMDGEGKELGVAGRGLAHAYRL